MLSYAQAAVLGLLQGITELFPVSSLGHSVILPALLGWHLDQASTSFVSFVVLTHLATALVLLGFFWQDWVHIVRGIVRSLRQRRVEGDTYSKLGWLIVVSTIPAGLLGLLFEKKLTTLFAAPRLVAGALVLKGIVLYIAEQLRKKYGQLGTKDDGALTRLSWTQAIGIGFAQCFALIPGLSRTGLTMTGGLLSDLSHENAARYAFMLATPIILAASVLEVPHIFTHGSLMVGQSLFGALCAAIAAYFSVRFLSKYFKSKTLIPFAVYCVIAGAISFFLLG